MICLVENACRFTADYGDMWESYYDSVISNFGALLKHIDKAGLFDVYRRSSCDHIFIYFSRSFFLEELTGRRVPSSRMTSVRSADTTCFIFTTYER